MNAPAGPSPGTKRITLTFDNGPTTAVTPLVLDVLRAHRVRAHFYVLGRALATEEGRALVKRALSEGHCIGNHSFSHETPLGEDPRPESVDAEIVATSALLDPLLPVAPVEPRRFRPFGGGGALGPHLLSRRAAEYLSAEGYTCVLWTSVPRDWVDPDGWGARALVDCASRAHSVVVLHDVPNACLAGLPAFLVKARARGFDFALDLPEDCTPILGGRIVANLEPFMADAR